MMRQRQIATNLGKDTHVRNGHDNMFKTQASHTFQMMVGEIAMTEPEPLFRQTMVNVALARGGNVTSVAYPGAFIDPITGNLHGTYEGPIPGQEVIVGFENGNVNAPFVVNRYPYQGIGDTFYEGMYINPLTKALYDSQDVIIGHFSGASLSFNTGILSGKLPGSVTLTAVTDFDLTSGTSVLLDSIVSTEIKSAVVTLTGSTAVELNGNTDFSVRFSKLKEAFDELQNDVTTLKNAFTAWVVVPQDGGAALKAAAGVWAGTPFAFTIDAAKVDDVLLP